MLFKYVGSVQSADKVWEIFTSIKGLFNGVNSSVARGGDEHTEQSF